MCLEYGLIFVSVRRIYFTLPKERRCCVSHCLGKKPGCKLSETLWRESRRARTSPHAHTRTHTRARRGSQQRSGTVCCAVLCCVSSLRFSSPVLQTLFQDGHNTPVWRHIFWTKGVSQVVRVLFLFLFSSCHSFLFP